MNAARATVASVAPASAALRANARRALELAIEEAIARLDALDGDPDMEDGGDAEPSLGSLEGAGFLVVTQRDALGYAMRTRLNDPCSQLRWADHATDDLEVQCEDEGARCDDEGSDSDREPDRVGPLCRYDGADQRRVLVGSFAGQRFYEDVR